MQCRFANREKLVHIQPALKEMFPRASNIQTNEAQRKKMHSARPCNTLVYLELPVFPRGGALSSIILCLDKCDDATKLKVAETSCETMCFKTHPLKTYFYISHNLFYETYRYYVTFLLMKTKIICCEMD